MSRSEEQFIQSVCEVLERSLADVEQQMGSRLDAARMAALQRSSAADPSADETMLADSLLNSLEDQPQPDFVNKRLDAMRARAIGQLDAAPASTSRNSWQAWLDRVFTGAFPLPASMLATACVLLTVVSLVYVNDGSRSNMSLDDELVLVASADDLELYENLDFYLWLDENGFTY